MEAVSLPWGLVGEERQAFLLAWTIAGLFSIAATVVGLRHPSAERREQSSLRISSVVIAPGFFAYLIEFVLRERAPILSSMLFLLVYPWLMVGLPAFVAIFARMIYLYGRANRWRGIWIPVAHALFMSATAYDAVLAVWHAV